MAVTVRARARCERNRAAGPTVTIDTASPSGKVSPFFYGLMTEEINHAHAMAASTLNSSATARSSTMPPTAAHWSLVQADGSTATMALDPKEPLNTTIGTSLRLNVTQASTGHVAGIANEGYWGIPVQPNTRYRASFYAKAAPGFTAPVARLDPERRRPDDLRDEDRHRADARPGSSTN